MSDNTVNNSTLKAVAVPALVAAGVVILVAVLVLQSDWAGPPDGGKAGAVTVPVVAGPPGVSGKSDDASTDGMAQAVPSESAIEWKPTGANGLQVWDVKEGAGEPCPSDASVTIHYTGWLTSGSVFDSSVPRKTPNTFSLSGLIKGWQEGIPGMKAGGIRRLLIPSQLGYGAGGSPPKIPGGATLVFEIKLIAFQGR